VNEYDALPLVSTFAQPHPSWGWFHTPPRKEGQGLSPSSRSQGWYCSLLVSECLEAPTNRIYRATILVSPHRYPPRHLLLPSLTRHPTIQLVFETAWCGNRKMSMLVKPLSSIRQIDLSTRPIPRRPPIPTFQPVGNAFVNLIPPSPTLSLPPKRYKAALSSTHQLHHPPKKTI
jgi:hypothetical protein